MLDRPWWLIRCALLAGVASLTVAAPGASLAAAATGAAEAPSCTITGFVPDSPTARAELREQLIEEDLRLADGEVLDRERPWVVPDGAEPVLVLDSSAPLPGGSVQLAAAGERFELGSREFDEEGEQPSRYVSNVELPHLGDTTRVLGLEVTGGECAVGVVLGVDRSVWSTTVGQAAIAATMIFALITVLLGRLNRGGWLVRFLSAAPAGLLTGVAVAALLYEAGLVNPFGLLPWWWPVAGLGLAAVLPFTRWPRPAPAASQPAPAETQDGAPAPTADATPDAGPAETVAVTPERRRWLDISAQVGAVAAAVLLVGAAVLVVGPAPAQAQRVVVTPEQAHVVFEQTFADGLERRFDFIPFGPRRAIHALATSDDAIQDAGLAEVAIGVPPAQWDYPAWFVVTAELHYGDELASIFARFDRVAADEPWQMTTFTWAQDRAPQLALDSDGWLAPAPELTTLSYSAEELVDRYRELADRQQDELIADNQLVERPELVTDDVLDVRPGGGSFLRELHDVVYSFPFDLFYYLDTVGDEPLGLSVELDLAPDLESVQAVPLADGTTLLSVALTAEHATHNRARDDAGEPRNGSCEEHLNLRYSGAVNYRVFATDHQLLLLAWLPAAGDHDEATDAAPAVQISDPILTTDRPAEERSERC